MPLVTLDKNKFFRNVSEAFSTGQGKPTTTCLHISEDLKNWRSVEITVANNVEMKCVSHGR